MDIWGRLVEINIGRLERGGRGLIGLGLVVFALAWPTAWGWLGLYPLLTGLIGISPLYKVLGVSTGPKRRVAKTPPPLTLPS